MVYDFNVAVSGDKVEVTSPQLDIQIRIHGGVPDNLLELSARTAYLYCIEQKIPVAGGTFVVTGVSEDLSEGGYFQGLFVPEPQLRH